MNKDEKSFRDAAAPASGRSERPTAGEPATSPASQPEADRLSSVVLPTIAAPRGGGAIRSIGETFRANLTTGTGSLAIPIPLSPSRGGSQPQLTLGYDSGAGQGPFGIGWSVDLPSITRRTDKGLPRYADMEESDEFVLSGAEVLVPAVVPVRSGFQRDAFQDGRYQVQRYRPRVESAFTLIEKRTDLVTGEVHWRTTTRDNVTSLFGRSPQARLADPEQPDHVFSWYLEATFDDRGNVTWFEYKPEDTASVPRDRVEESTRLAGPGRFANRYLKRIHYGNRTALATVDPAPADLAAPGYLFEVVFDYGEHDLYQPTPREVAGWSCRPDPFSSFRSGFDVRTYRLVSRVLMFHRFAELGPDPVLVRSLDLSYETSPVTSYLRHITETGWRPRPAPATGYEAASMPRLDLDYTRADLHTTVQALGRDSVVDAPGGIDGSRYRFVDLDGEGIPGVLTQQAGALFYKRNRGGGVLARAEVLPAQPSVTALGRGEQMLTSLEADGRMDLVLLGSLQGFFERDDATWAPFRTFRQTPRFDPADPNLRFLDLDGDGLADALVADDQAFVWSRSLGRDGFEQPRVVRKSSDQEIGPDFVFADATQSIFLADMTGDGLTDLVRVRNGEICYWPNLGYGRFGARIIMGNAPHFDRPESFDPRRIRFGDVDGSGTSDVVYVRRDGVAIYRNQAGNRWSDPVDIGGIPGRPDAAIDLVDLLGTGTACLVWSSPELGEAVQPVRYVDLLASTKPHLLANIVNNLGRETRITYTSSTRFYLEDRAAGAPWVTRLPFPVHVVARVDTVDQVQGSHLVTTYRYKHGLFDGAEREFRGFGRIDQWDAERFVAATGELAVPPAHTITWIDTGAVREARELYARYRAEQYALDPAAPPLADPVVPPGLSAIEEREAARARKGAVLRREVYADDGSPAAAHPYMVEEHRYEVARVQPMLGERHPVWFSHEREAVVRHYERRPADPRVEHTFTLELDAFGNVVRAATVAYPRRMAAEPEQRVLLATCTEASFANAPAPFMGPADHYRVGLPVETRTYELTGLARPPGLLARSDVDREMQRATPLSFDTAPTPGKVEKRVIGHRRTLYWDDRLTAPLALGAAGTRALVYEAYAKALTASLAAGVFGSHLAPAALTTALRDDGGYVNLDGDWWRPSGRSSYDASRFYQATAMTDPFGNTTRVVLDGNGLLPIEAHTSDDTALDNVVKASNDYRVLLPALVTDPNGNQTAVTFDALGMVVAMAVLGKGSGDGDTAADPTARLEYDLLAWQEGRGPAGIHTFAREKHGAGNPRWQETYRYSDGSGHEAMTKTQAPSDGAGRAWIGTGRTVFDNKGNPIKKYEPYFSATPGYESEPSIVMTGVTPILHYDPIGRLVRTDLPGGGFETVDFDAWSETRADANDNVLDSAWYAARLPTAIPMPSPAEQRAAKLAARHAHTPAVIAVDALGRPFLTIEDNGSDGAYATRTALDIEGNARTVTDARTRIVHTQRFGLERRVLETSSVDAGDRLVLSDVAGNPIRSWDGRGFAIRTRYDRVRRPVRTYETPPAGTEILAELVVYGEAAADGGASNNLRGRTLLMYDGAGELQLSSYDFHGNLTTEERTLAAAYQTTPDWMALDGLTDVAAIRSAAAALLETEVFVTTTSFDALDRVTRTTTPDASVVVPSYNEANLLARLDVQILGAAATQVVTALDYNPRGQRLRASYANGTTTTYTYDPQTFLLTRQTTARGGALLQDAILTYDPVGNVVAIDDRADASLYFTVGGSTLPAGGGEYEYDAIYRLCSATGREHPALQMPEPGDLTIATLPHPNDTQALRTYLESYVYDQVGNLRLVVHRAGGTGWTRHYTYATGSNRLASTSVPGDPDDGPYSAIYDHDASGNLTRMPHLPTIAWDHAGRMQSADKGGGGTVYFTYDRSGIRARKVWVHGGLIEQRIYLRGYELYRRSSGGAVAQERQTLHVLDDKQRVAMIETLTVDAGTVVASPVSRFRYQLANHLGSASVELDGSGKIITYEEFAPFGATSFRSAIGGLEVSAKRYRYTGKERDDETGLAYHDARYYALWLARWASPDPAGMVDGSNLYAYARGNPLRFTDPGGRAADDRRQSTAPDHRSPATDRAGDPRSETGDRRNYTRRDGTRVIYERAPASYTQQDNTLVIYERRPPALLVPDKVLPFEPPPDPTSRDRVELTRLEEILAANDAYVKYNQEIARFFHITSPKDSIGRPGATSTRSNPVEVFKEGLDLIVNEFPLVGMPAANADLTPEQQLNRMRTIKALTAGPVSILGAISPNTGYSGAATTRRPNVDVGPRGAEITTTRSVEPRPTLPDLEPLPADVRSSLQRLRGERAVRKRIESR